MISPWRRYDISLFLWIVCVGFAIYAQPLFAKDAKPPVSDRIVVHDMVLHGQVMGLGAERLSFKLDYAEWINHIRYSDIQEIQTAYRYHISYKRIDIEGRIVGIVGIMIGTFAYTYNVFKTIVYTPKGWEKQPSMAL